MCNLILCLEYMVGWRGEAVKGHKIDKTMFSPSPSPPSASGASDTEEDTWNFVYAINEHGGPEILSKLRKWEVALATKIIRFAKSDALLHTTLQARFGLPPSSLKLPGPEVLPLEEAHFVVTY